MDIQTRVLAATAVAMLALPATVGARDLGFNYVEANYINVDADIDERFVDDVGFFALESDTGGGLHVAAAVEIWDGFHLFGEYSQAEQDLDLIEDNFLFRGDFDVVRWRAGAGFSAPMSDMMQVYGRLTFDSTEFRDQTIEGQNLGSDKDDGLGAEAGLLWAASRELHLQGYVRYTEVGEIDLEEFDTFDSDVLAGVFARWYLTEQFAMQLGYEGGAISTGFLGVRFAF
jgi:hypothetical protein